MENLDRKIGTYKLSVIDTINFIQTTHATNIYLLVPALNMYIFADKAKLIQDLELSKKIQKFEKFPKLIKVSTMYPDIFIG